MPTFVYIDEANDCIDRNIAIILEQARKFKIGMILSHQYLGQLDSKLQDAVFANTSIRFAGGVSAKDACVLAGEMRADASYIESGEKLTFAAFVRGTTKKAISISITPGAMERLPHMNDEQRQRQREIMRERYAVYYEFATHGGSAENKSGNGHAEASKDNNAGKNSDRPDNDPLSGKESPWP